METGFRSENPFTGGYEDNPEKSSRAIKGSSGRSNASLSLRDIPVREHNTRRRRDLRSVVAGRFMRMLRAHDRVRMKMLAAQPRHAR